MAAKAGIEPTLNHPVERAIIRSGLGRDETSHGPDKIFRPVGIQTP
jgi:hypothetical protein